MTQKIVALTAAAWLEMGHGAAFAAEFCVERPGDADMSCEALAGEITTLSTAQAKAAERAAKGRRLLGFATSAMQVAAPLVTGGLVRDAAAAAVVQQAAGMVQTQVLQQQMSGNLAGEQATRAPAPETPQALRVAHLKALQSAKGC